MAALNGAPIVNVVLKFILTLTQACSRPAWIAGLIPTVLSIAAIVVLAWPQISMKCGCDAGPKPSSVPAEEEAEKAEHSDSDSSC